MATRQGESGTDQPGLDDEDAPARDAIHPVARLLLPTGRTLRDWWRDLLVLSLASLAWSALSLTVIGGPPAGAALYTLARATVLHEQPDASLFVAAFRSYFGKSWLLGSVGLLGIILWILDLSLYLSLLGDHGLLATLGAIFLFYIGVVWLQTLFYAWPLLVCRDDLKLLALLRNGALIALRFPGPSFVASLFICLLLAAALYLTAAAVLVIPPLVCLLGIHSLYMLAPELVPEDREALGIVG